MISACSCPALRRSIAQERYEITVQNFENGTVSVTDLNTAQSELESAQKRFISELSNYWLYYFNIRKASLYDFMSNTDISAEYDRLIEK